MQFTELQLEMIQHRLDVPDAMAEVLADTQQISYEEAFELVEKHATDLVYKLQADLPLYPVEVALVIDIASDKSYLACCENAIGVEWDDGKPMTHRRYNQIERSYYDLREKLSRGVVVW